jgi:O-antigen/teichoic acid export membrane protein
MIRNLGRGIATSYVALGSQVAWLLLLTPYLIDRRGAAAFGAWAIVFALTGFMRGLDHGFGVAAARFVAAARERSELDGIVASAVVLLAAVGAVSLAAGLAVAAASGALFGDVEGLGAAIAIASAGVAVAAPLSAFGWTLFGVQRIADRNAWIVIRMLLSGAAIVVAVELGAGLAGWVAAGAAAEVAALCGQAIWCLARVEGLRPRPRDFDPARLRALVRFSAGALALSAAAQITFYSDGIVIGAALAAADVAVYTVGMRLVDGVSQVLRQFSEVFLPVFSELHAQERRERARAIVDVGTRVTLLVGYPLLALLVALGQPLVELWVGDGFDRSWVPLALLAGATALHAPLRFAMFWSMGAAQHGVLGAIAVAEALANLGLSLALVGPLGIDGVALATFVALAVSNGLVIPRIAYRRMGGGAWSGFLRPVALAAGALAVPVVLGRLVVSPAVEGDVVLTVVAAVVFSAVAFVVLAVVLFSAGERRGAMRVVRERLTRLRAGAPAGPTEGT